MILWHMHQPYYKDLVEDRYLMPWVRLHTLKDYYGMVAMLREFPDVHVTFNLVPSLVAQILDYANGAAHGDAFDLAFKSGLTQDEKSKLVKYAFQINHENLLRRYPRFSELFDRAKGSGTEPQVEPISTPQEILDLQALSQLAWFDEIYLAGDPEIRALMAKQHGYTDDDKARIYAKEMELFQVTLEEYKIAAARGQIEISTSPFYHPILPLLCDTQAGADSTPGLPLPRLRFRHPEDARGQLRAAAALCEKVFGKKPVGLWPSEGSVSSESLRIAAEEGFKWAATDEGVLGRSLRTFFHHNPDGTVQDAGRLYTPYRFATGEESIALFFRDHPISDLIGFVYSRMDPEAAARDLIQRIRVAAGSSGRQNPVVSIILDGENAWEYYPGNGREFLKRLYSLLSSESDIQTMTPREILTEIEPEPLLYLTPGSWIQANFNVWIGAEEDNRAWDLLSQARNFFALNEHKPGLDPRNVELARQELWIAEGSDWCWWYGPEHSTANDEAFDALYRKHLSNIYRLLGGQAPDDLVRPIKRPRTEGYNIPPTDFISPSIDGRETTYFEWLGAGVYMPDARSGSIHGPGSYIKELFYGQNDTHIYLRFDFQDEFRQKRRDFQARVNFAGERQTRLYVSVSNNAVERVELWQGDRMVDLPGLNGGSRGAQAPMGNDGAKAAPPANGNESGHATPADLHAQPSVTAAFDSILEIGIARSLLGIDPSHSPSVQVSLWVDQLPVQALPNEGWLTLEVAEGLLSW